jgi:hypothetical protein
MEKKNAHVLRLAGLILGVTLAISLLVLLIGYIYQWDKPVQFSDAFFAAGAIIIILGIFSVIGGFAQRANFNILYAESAGQANLAERSQRIVAEVTQRYGVVILLVSTGLVLIGIAIAIGRVFIIK